MNYIYIFNLVLMYSILLAVTNGAIWKHSVFDMDRYQPCFQSR